MDKEKLEKIIASSNFEQLIGEIENDWLECKGQPYQIETEKDKRELAKDITSLANIQGGYILIGVKTERSTTHSVDEIKELKPLKQELINSTQYHDIIKHWTYPEIENIDIRWFQDKSNKEKGYWVINVPQQKESLKPFLITKTLEDNKFIETIFGYSERKRETSPSFSAVDLQRALRLGFNYENKMEERFNNLDTQLKQLTNPPITQKDTHVKKDILEFIQETKNQTEVLDKWFDERHQEAKQGLKKLGFKLFMEVKMYPEKLIAKENQELKNIAQKSTIHTFGWPIAVFLDGGSSEKDAPQPKQYGIQAEISIGKESDNFTGKRYDYWALKKDGAFYLLKSLFEDSRKPGYLFFNTRIIRITEVLMYAFNLYSKLGLNDDEKIIIQIKHSGLKGLIMGAVGGRDFGFGEFKNNSENEVSSEKIETTIKDLDEKTADLVERFVKPLFESFNWLIIEKKVIDDIVLNYKQGRVT
jgi:hypothetical protein